MAKLIYGLNMSLDGYVNHDHPNFLPDPVLFRYFIGQARACAGSIYGRTMYELMRIWDEDLPNWDAAEREYAQAWRSHPKWVVSKTLNVVGPHASLITGDVEGAIRGLKEQVEGELEIAGPTLAGSLKDPSLIDAYVIYLRPAVVGSAEGRPFFTGPRPPLHLVSVEQVSPEVVKLVYVPA